MILVDGKTKAGLGVASRCIAMQMPLLAAEFPEIRDCRRGTINVELEHPLHIDRPDHETAPIAWHPKMTERFSFLRCQFECPTGSKPVSAWIYIAHGSPHFAKVNYFEVLAQSLGDIASGTPCRLHLPTSKVSVGS